MEQAGSWGNLIAQGAIVLFLVALLILIIRSTMMFGSVVLLAITGRKGTGQIDLPTDAHAKEATDRPVVPPSTPSAPSET